MNKFYIRNYEMRLANILMRLAIALITFSIIVFVAQIFAYLLMVLIFFMWAILILLSVGLLLLDPDFRNFGSTLGDVELNKFFDPLMKALPYIIAIGYSLLVLSLIVFIINKRDVRAKNGIITTSIILGVTVGIFILVGIVILVTLNGGAEA